LFLGEGASHSKISHLDKQNITINENSMKKTFTVDRIFDSDTTQEDIYEEVRDSVDNIFDGYNSTIFAYGQTGAGKSFTMLGKEDAWEEKNSMGIIPRAGKIFYFFFFLYAYLLSSLFQIK